ncbi:hypothetical protein Leryth_025400 [Lithospermum erythrorhizon]|nr:hypothetical protein Leryth_025400 [Lithospermum erythrorhizon]
MDSCSDYQAVFKEIMRFKICLFNSSLYESYALTLEMKEKLIDAFMVYHLGISRKAQPLARLKKAQVLFLERCSDRLTSASVKKMEPKENNEFVNPWLVSTTKSLLEKMNADIIKKVIFIVYCINTVEIKEIEIGRNKYQIKGCAGQGGFAQVLKAHSTSNPEDGVVALKIQKPPFPWEFYMYRQLDRRIPQAERMSFGFAHEMHLFADYSIIISEYFGDGTLQDAINLYLCKNTFMDEVLCMYYTIELLHMLEILHDADIIHGDLKPDNLLLRNSRDDLTVDGDAFLDRTGSWNAQGLCLIDWGRGIDLSLFPPETKFIGDSRTSGFRCIEMQEKKAWTFEVDAYGLCAIAHTMLHGKYMEIDHRISPNDFYDYQPKLAFKRYWKGELWKELFSKLLNMKPSEDYKKTLQALRKKFQDYLCTDPTLVGKLKQLLLNQKASIICST